MARATRAALAALTLLALAACSDDTTDVDTGGDATTTTAAGSGPAPGLVLQISTGGGFVPPEFLFATFPVVSLYGDGRVITTGPTTQEYPGRALPNLLTGTVPASAVEDALTRARESGVLDEPELGTPGVADAPSTSFVVVAGGRTTTFAAYALGMEDLGQLTTAQRAARRKLSDLVTSMEPLQAAADQPYEATTVSVLVQEPATDQAVPEPAPEERDWPLADLGTGGTEAYGGRCLGFSGAEAGRVLDAAGAARSNTRWRSGGKVWSLTFRPELPGVAACSPR